MYSQGIFNWQKSYAKVTCVQCVYTPYTFVDSKLLIYVRW